MTTATTTNRRDIPLALIDEPSDPSRTDMDPVKMDELIESIRTNGFFSVVVVVEHPRATYNHTREDSALAPCPICARAGRFEVVAGHRRLLGARRAGLVAVPCVIYEPGDPRLERIQQAENSRREDVNAVDEAIKFAGLMMRYPEAGTDGVAAMVGETRNYVEGRLAILDGCERVKGALKAGDIGIGVAHELNKCSEERHRWMLLDDAIARGATVGLVRNWITEWKVLHRHVLPNGLPPEALEPQPPVLSPVYFTCYCCKGTNNPERMHAIQVHDFCIPARLDPALKRMERSSDYVDFPTTVDDARKLATRLVERFPELAE